MSERADRMQQAAMSFEEIGAALGIGRGGAWMLYRSAIRKLKKRPHSLAVLRSLAAELDKKRRGECE